MKLHKGKPANPGVMRFLTGTLFYKGNDGRVAEKQYTSHHISKMFGISWCANWFIGFVRFSETTMDRDRRNDGGE